MGFTVIYASLQYCDCKGILSPTYASNKLLSVGVICSFEPTATISIVVLLKLFAYFSNPGKKA